MSMRVAALVMALCMPPAAGAPPATDAAKAEIDLVLQASAADWSRGDLAGFMRSYEPGAGTVFVAGGGLVQGFGAIQARYARRYGAGTGHGMGLLSMSMIDYRRTGPDTALVTGRYALARPAADGGAAGGVFTLLFHHSAAGWRIAYDHTS